MAHPLFALHRHPRSPFCGLGTAWVRQTEIMPAPDENYFLEADWAGF
jgi:hypothetical protein